MIEFDVFFSTDIPQHVFLEYGVTATSLTAVTEILIYHLHILVLWYQHIFYEYDPILVSVSVHPQLK